jgi:hypothetical protein
MVSIQLFMNGKSNLPSGFDRKHLPVVPARFDGYLQLPFGYPQPSCWYRLSARSERWLLSSRIPNGTNRTHIEDVKDPDKILLPGSNLILIALHEDESGECIPFTPLFNLPLHLGHGPAIWTLVSRFISLRVYVAGLAHVVNSPIASRTAWVSSSNCLPFNLR